MATKAGMGRLVFCEHTADGRPGGVRRKEYQVTPLFDKVAETPTHFMAGAIGYVAICPCALGDHFLGPSSLKQGVVEYTVNRETPMHVYPTLVAAMSAIEAWQAQHDAAQAHSGESGAE